MNVNIVTGFLPSYVVLIDTWWNVNSVWELIVKWNNIVLIDTWWNVNQFNNGFGVWGI